jgi:hypothetical protein
VGTRAKRRGAGFPEIAVTVSVWFSPSRSGETAACPLRSRAVPMTPLPKNFEK